MRRVGPYWQAAIAAASLLLGVVAAPDRPSELAMMTTVPPMTTVAPPEVIAAATASAPIAPQPASPAPEPPPPQPLPPPPPPSPSPPSPPRPLARQEAVRFAPGGSAWYGATRRTSEPVGVVVDLGRQMAYVYRGARLIGASSVSTGRRGYRTPIGIFPILEKAAWHRSTKYSDAPMPFMERLTWGGVALHAGGVPGYRQSHGCIHLPRGFARTLFGITRVGSLVEVVNMLPRPRRATEWAARDAVPPRGAPLPSTEQSAAAMIAGAL